MAAGMVGLDEESLMRGTKRNIRLVARDSWLPEFLSWREFDADSYSRNGHPQTKLIFVRKSGEVENGITLRAGMAQHARHYSEESALSTLSYLPSTKNSLN